MWRWRLFFINNFDNSQEDFQKRRGDIRKYELIIWILPKQLSDGIVLTIVHQNFARKNLKTFYTFFHFWFNTKKRTLKVNNASLSTSPSAPRRSISQILAAVFVVVISTLISSFTIIIGGGGEAKELWVVRATTKIRNAAPVFEFIL